jgi:hypothetical protein
MAIGIVLTYTRTNTGVPFYPFSDDLVELIQIYQSEGKISGYAVDTSQENKLIYRLTYANDSVKTEFRNKAAVVNYQDQRDEYNHENSISTTLDEYFL